MLENKEKFHLIMKLSLKNQQTCEVLKFLQCITVYNIFIFSIVISALADNEGTTNTWQDAEE